MRYVYTLPTTLEKLVAESEASAPDIERLCQLARYLATFKAVRDWPRLRRADDEYAKDEIMQAAREACESALKRPTQEGLAITNSLEAFSLLFLQSYVGAYKTVIEMSEQNLDDIHTLVRLIRHRTESDAIALLAQLEKDIKLKQP